MPLSDSGDKEETEKKEMLKKQMSGKETIVLCGFMGCGKTAVGKRLAFYTRRPLIDMDAYIEERQGMKIPEIFSRLGEEAFREMEYQAACELAVRKKIIIPAGGGALTFQKNVEAFRKENCRIVLIDTSLKEISRRLRNDTKRPLLQREDKERAMKELYEKRYPLYRAAADIVVRGDRHMDAVAHDIMVKVGILEQDNFLSGNRGRNKKGLPGRMV